MKPEPRAQSQDVDPRAGLRAFAKVHRAIQAKEIRLARSNGAPALGIARPAFGNDLTTAVQDRINLLWRTPLLALSFQRSTISERKYLGTPSRLPGLFFQGRASPAPTSFHSYRSATMGSTFVALWAGI